MHVKLHRLQTGTQQFEILKRELGEDLIAKFGVVRDL
jgi:hypothetical protein